MADSIPDRPGPVPSFTRSRRSLPGLKCGTYLPSSATAHPSSDCALGGGRNAGKNCRSRGSRSIALRQTSPHDVQASAGERSSTSWPAVLLLGGYYSMIRIRHAGPCPAPSTLGSFRTWGIDLFLQQVARLVRKSAVLNGNVCTASASSWTSLALIDSEIERVLRVNAHKFCLNLVPTSSPGGILECDRSSPRRAAALRCRGSHIDDRDGASTIAHRARRDAATCGF